MCTNHQRNDDDNNDNRKRRETAETRSGGVGRRMPTTEAVCTEKIRRKSIRQVYFDNTNIFFLSKIFHMLHLISIHRVQCWIRSRIPSSQVFISRLPLPISISLVPFTKLHHMRRLLCDYETQNVVSFRSFFLLLLCFHTINVAIAIFVCSTCFSRYCCAGGEKSSRGNEDDRLQTIWEILSITIKSVENRLTRQVETTETFSVGILRFHDFNSFCVNFHISFLLLLSFRKALLHDTCDTRELKVFTAWDFRGIFQILYPFFQL